MACLVVQKEWYLWMKTEENFILVLLKHYGRYDIFHPKEHGVNTDEVFEIAEENNIKWELKIEDSLKTELPICDLIFFDTDHNYEQLSQELKLHANKSRKYLVFHDTMKYGLELVLQLTNFLKKMKNGLF